MATHNREDDQEDPRPNNNHHVHAGANYPWNLRYQGKPAKGTFGHQLLLYKGATEILILMMALLQLSLLTCYPLWRLIRWVDPARNQTADDRTEFQLTLMGTTACLFINVMHAIWMFHTSTILHWGQPLGHSTYTRLCLINRICMLDFVLPFVCAAAISYGDNDNAVVHILLIVKFILYTLLSIWSPCHLDLLYHLWYKKTLLPLLFTLPYITLLIMGRTPLRIKRPKARLHID